EGWRIECRPFRGLHRFGVYPGLTAWANSFRASGADLFRRQIPRTISDFVRGRNNALREWDQLLVEVCASRTLFQGKRNYVRRGRRILAEATHSGRSAVFDEQSRLVRFHRVVADRNLLPQPGTRCSAGFLAGAVRASEDDISGIVLTGYLVGVLE